LRPVIGLCQDDPVLITLLGPLDARAQDRSPVEIGGARVRMLLARLALEAGRPVPADALVEDLWGQEAPAAPDGALQALVSRLRKALQRAGVAESVELTAGGYRLPLRAEEVDVLRFETLAAQGRRELTAERPGAAAARLAEALGLWRGEAFVDVLEAPFAQRYAARLRELRAGAVADRFDAELRLGRYEAVVADITAEAAASPLNERLAELRIRALAGAGRQSEALLAYEQLRTNLAEELGADPSPALQQLHLALLRGELARSPARAEPAGGRLPAQLTSFVGRDAELARLARLCADSRLVTIVGPGGAGKTRLSLEAAARDQAHQHGRMWFVPLASVGAPDQVADAVLGVLGSADRGLYDAARRQEGAPVDRIAELLDVGDALLLLDNCEHLVEGVAELADQLLDRLPRLRILATSREPLVITGETLLHLGPLELPSGEPEPAAAAEVPAVRLFVDRARAVRPGFVLDESTLPAVVEICCRLDGIPLALELAAARLRAMSAGQIAQRLDDRFRLLTSGSRSALPRQRTLAAVVEWSWDLLGEPERQLARRLSVFPGGATLAAVEAVCADGSLPADEIVYVLGSLVEKSIAESSGEAEPRYRMLDTVRAYASVRLEESGDEVTGRFIGYFLALAEEHAPLLRTREQLRALALFDVEHANLLLALRGAIDTGELETATRLFRALFWYWGNRGMHARLEAFMTELLDFGDALPEKARGSLAALRLAGYGSSAAQEVHPARLLWIAQQAFSGKEFGAGEQELREALVSPDPWTRASAHWAHNFMLVEQGDLHSGAEASQAALRGFEEVGDRWGLVMCLLAVGRLPSLQGRFEVSIAAFERAVALSFELGTEDYLYWTGTRLARERMRAGDLEGGRRDVTAILERAERRGDRRRAATILFSLANLHRRAGELELAERTLDRLETLVARLPYPEQMARDLIAGTRLMIRLAAGEPGPARALLPTAVRPNFARRQSNGLAWASEQVAELLALEDEPAGAATALGLSQAIRGAFDQGEPVLRALVGRLTERLGPDGYQHAYDQGAKLDRRDALDRLAEATGQPVLE
jgi:predicted ATPase/DNA-binding SARP family transcriptional activator